MSRNIQIATPCTTNEEWHATKESIKSGWLTQGPKVGEFEKAFATSHNVDYALATTSCTTALHLILSALNIGESDEVIVPAFTWVATANVVRYCGAKVIFADVDTSTNNICIARLSEKITSRTKAIIPVHLFGLCADIDAIKQAIPDSVAIIEDAACAAGAQYQGKYAGSLGTAGAFSFHPRKTITTGEGGMVTTNDPTLADKMNILRNHGASISEEVRHHGNQPYLLPEFNMLGFNYRMTDLQASIGTCQLTKLEQFIKERAKWAAWYKKALANLEWIRCPEEPQSGRHSWQAFVLYIDPKTAPLPRNGIMRILQEKGVSTRPGTHAVHMLGYYKDLYGLEPDDFPGARDCNNNTMAIPLHNKMDEEDYAYVVQCLKEIGV